MRKSELVAAVVESTGLSPLQADDVVASMLEQITNTLARGEGIQLIGFGSFLVKERAARNGKNPKTGQPIHIPAKKQVQFKAGSKLRSQLFTGE